MDLYALVLKPSLSVEVFLGRDNHSQGLSDFGCEFIRVGENLAPLAALVNQHSAGFIVYFIVS
jgi:hypothetical protein